MSKFVLRAWKTFNQPHVFKTKIAWNPNLGSKQSIINPTRPVLIFSKKLFLAKLSKKNTDVWFIFVFLLQPMVVPLLPFPGSSHWQQYVNQDSLQTLVSKKSIEYNAKQLELQSKFVNDLSKIISPSGLSNVCLHFGTLRSKTVMLTTQYCILYFSLIPMSTMNID